VLNIFWGIAKGTGFIALPPFPGQVVPGKNSILFHEPHEYFDF
jgi:hypothetical protein